jgi:glycosyltransferase involved in cell wall biosynthesis
MVRHNLLWVIDCPSPYNSYLLEAVAADPAINLVVYFVREGVQSHPWKQISLTRFYWRVIDRRTFVDWSLLRKALGREPPFLILGGWSDLTLQFILTFSPNRFAVWTDTPRAQNGAWSVRESVRSFWLKKVLNRASYVLGTGRPALEALAKMGSPTEKLINFPYFVDLACFNPTGRAPARDALVYVSSGRLEDVKGFDVSLKALAKAYEGRSESFVYRIAGTGSCELKLRQLAGELGIAESVEFLGWLEPEQLPSFYESGDVMVHPARAEPYGVSILEAMATGLIILASDRTNAAMDRIDEGVQGYVHRMGDVEELTRHIKTILSGGIDLQGMQIASRARADEWPVSRAIAVIKSMLTNSTAPTFSRVACQPAAKSR